MGRIEGGGVGNVRNQEDISSQSQHLKVVAINTDRHMSPEYMGKKICGKSLRKRSVNLIEHKIPYVGNYEKKNLNALDKIISSYNLLSLDGLGRKKNISDLQSVLSKIKHSDVISGHISKYLPDEIRWCFIERYIDLKSNEVAEKITNNTDDTGEIQYNKISRILELPFSKFSLLGLVVDHSVDMLLKNFGQLENDYSRVVTKFTYTIYSNILYALENVDMPSNITSRKDFLESSNERKIELEVLKNQVSAASKNK